MEPLLISLSAVHNIEETSYRSEMQPFLETVAGHRYQFHLFSELQRVPERHIFAFPPFHDRYNVFHSSTTTAPPQDTQVLAQIQNLLTQLTAHILNIEDNTVVHESFLHFRTNNFRIEFTPMGGAILFMTITPPVAAPASVQSMLHTLDRLLNTTDIREPV